MTDKQKLAKYLKAQRAAGIAEDAFVAVGDDHLARRAASLADAAAGKAAKLTASAKHAK